VFTKLFRIWINFRLKLNILILWIVFKTYYNYLTIDRLCLIKYVLQTRLLGILSVFFIKEKVNFIVATVMKKLSLLNIRINFIIVNCLQHVL